MYQLGNILYLYRHYKKDKDSILRYTLISVIPMRDVRKKNYCRHYTVIIMMGIMDI